MSRSRFLSTIFMDESDWSVENYDMTIFARPISRRSTQLSVDMERVNVLLVTHLISRKPNGVLSIQKQLRRRTLNQLFQR